MKIYKAIMLLTLVASNITFAQISTNLTGVNSGINGLTQISGESAADVSGSDAVVIDGFDIIMAIENSSFYGGEGGSATAVVGVGNSVNANGGIGIRVNSNEVDDYTYGTDTFTSSNIIVIGGSGGSAISAPGVSHSLSGGSGVSIYEAIVTLNGGNFSGGDAGSLTNITGSTDVDTIANGGDGIYIGEDSQLSLSGIVSATGGDGGSIINSGEMSNVEFDGGAGLSIEAYDWGSAFGGESTTDIVLGGSYTGGVAGSSVSLNNIIVTNQGGDGVFVAGNTITLTNGSYIGGAGGVLTDANEASKSLGGKGFFSSGNYNLTILDGYFNGGLGGSVNGNKSSDGAALYLENSIVTIEGGTFDRGGIVVDINSTFINNNLAFNGGESTQINLISQVGTVASAKMTSGNVGYARTSGLGLDQFSFSGGVVSNIVLNSSGQSDIVLSGGIQIVDGFSVLNSGSYTLSISNEVASLGQVVIQDGTTDVNLWNDDHFTDTMVSGGVLNFNNQDFNLIDGAVMRLTSADAVVNFKGTNTAVKSGAQLDLGAGRTTANALTVESGGSVRSTVYGSNGIVSVGSLEADQLTLDVGASWRLYNDGTFTDYESLLNSNAFLLGVSTNAITHGLTSSDVELIGEGMDAYWLYSINDLVVTNEGSLYKLYARYGMQNLGEALNAEGDFLTLMNLMQSEVDTNVDLQNALINYGSADAASSAITDGFLRTTEMGSTLVGAQSVLADQIGVRTREHLRSFRLAGKTGPSGARGPASWWDRSMNRLHDALPSFNLRDSMRSAQDRTSEPTVSDERPSVKKPWISGVQGGAIPSFTSEIVIPSHYQTWGRAYVADLDQESTDGFAGYDASVRGGVLGVDRRFDHAVVGVAGGMSKTIVTGGDGHSGEADSLQSTVYASYFTDRVYLNAHISFASSDVETDGVSMFGYRSEYDANSLSFFVGAGIGYKGFNDGVMITPEVSLLSSKYSRDGYTSSSSMSQTLGFEDMVFDSYDQWSYQSELGVAFSSIKLIENTRLQMAFQPEFRVHWVHEFEPNPDGERYEFVGSTQALHAQLQSREENLIRLGGGVRCWNWNSQTTEFGLNLDHLKGDAYTEWMFSGHLIHRF